MDLSVREAMSELHSSPAKADYGLVDGLEKLPYVCATIEQLKLRKRSWNAHMAEVFNGVMKGRVSCRWLF